MKTLLIFALFLMPLLGQADSLCGGTCSNTTSHAFMNRVCDTAQVDGQTQCRQFSMLGCVWKDFTKAIVRGSSCVNGTKDRTLDAKCSASEASDKECVKTPGCVWFPAAYTCHH